MSTIALPSWLDVSDFELTLVPDVRSFPGPFGGPTEVLDLLGDRWVMRFTLPDGDYRQGGRAEALFGQLRGGVNWLRVHHLARPVPAGTARGTVTLSSALAQGASSLPLTGLTPDATLLAGDMLGHNNEQLWQVAEDVTVSGAGTATVPITGRVRKAVASGQVIAWDKPGIPMQLLDAAGVPASYVRARARGQSVSFVEARA